MRGGGFGGARHFSGGPMYFGRGAPRFSGRTGRLPMRRPSFARPDRRTTNRPASSNIARNRAAMPPAARLSRTFPQRGLNGRTDHISERHEANWHGDWDRRHAHFDHGHFFVFDDGFWFGLDDGVFPWDYLPYYADDYYPYDYYADTQPDDNTAPVYNDAPVADATVQAAQTQLTQLGYYGGPVDGFFGPSTRDAVAKYQVDKQLNVTGSLSPDTLQSLGLPQATSS
jgi:Putative peptidoglycan binding domain